MEIPEKIFSHAEYLESFMTSVETQSRMQDTIDSINLENISLIQKIDVLENYIARLEMVNRNLMAENEKLKSLLN